MAQNFNHVSHIKSRLPREIEEGEFYGLTPTTDNSEAQGSSPIKLNLAKRPTADNLVEGEIAVNYLKGHETLTIKNTEDEIVAFVNENDFNEAQQIVALGLAEEKDERMSDIARLERVIDEDIDHKIEELKEEVDDKFDTFDRSVERIELAVSSSLNDLNSRIIANGEKIDDVDAKVDELEDGIDEKLEDLEEEFDGKFDAFDRSVERIELTISSSLNDLNSRIIANGEKIDELEDGIDEKLEDLEEEFDDKLENMQNVIDDNELITSSALNDLNSRIIANGERIDEVEDGIADIETRISEIEDSIDDKIDELSDEVDGKLEDLEEEFDDKLENMQNDIDDTELVISSSLNDLNSRIIANGEKIDEVDAKVDELAEEIGDDIDEKLEEIQDDINTIDLTVSSSLNDLNSRIIANDEKFEEIEDSIQDLADEVDGKIDDLADEVDEKFEQFDSDIEDIEHTISSSLNDLNTRIRVTNEVIDDNYAQLERYIDTLKEKAVYNDNAYVDLGLPSGLLWARENVGSEPNEIKYGLYFAWGEPQGYEYSEVGINKTFDVQNYKWTWNNNTPNNEPIKYNSTDTLTTLLPLNDAANVNMRGSWRLPTKTEVEELIANTTQDYDPDYLGTGTPVYIFTSTANGNELYIPCAGVANGSSVSDNQHVTNPLTNACAYIWTSTLDESDNTQAYYLYCSGNTIELRKATYNRANGMSVRGVAM